MNLKIDEKLTDNLSKKIRVLEQSLEDINYNVCFECIKFNYLNDVNFSIDDLKNIYLNVQPPIDGDIVTSDFQPLLNDVHEALSCFSYDQEQMIKTKDEAENIINQRVNFFWNIISEYFFIPPKVVYTHLPDLGSYFDSYVMWGFCYVLLNEKDGLVISGRSWD